MTHIKYITAVFVAAAAFAGCGFEGHGVIDGIDGIAWRATTSQMIKGGTTITSVTLDAPESMPGDVLIATIAMGSIDEPVVPSFTPPSGWTFVRQTNKGLQSSLAVYWHVFDDSEPSSYTWTFNQAEQGIAWISSYSGVSNADPIDVESGILDSSMTTSYTLPPITTSVANPMIVGAYAGHDPGDAAIWVSNTGMSRRSVVNNGTTRSGLGIDDPWSEAGPTPTYVATASAPQEYALMHVLALRPEE